MNTNMSMRLLKTSNDVQSGPFTLLYMVLNIEYTLPQPEP